MVNLEPYELDELKELVNQHNIAEDFTDWDSLTKRYVKYEKGEIIAMFGTELRKIFFLIKGTVRFTSLNDDYEEYFFFDANNSGLFGEVEYVLNIPLITQSQAMNECVCIELPMTPYNKKILDADIKFQKAICRVLANKYNNQRFVSMSSEMEPVEVRLSKFIISGNLSILTNMDNISKTLKCSRRQLIRVLQTFCELGYCRHEKRGCYSVINREKIRELLI